MFQSCTDAYVLDVFTLSLLHQPEEGETGKTFKCLPRREKEENLQISLPVGGTGKTFKSLHHHPEVELSMLVPNGEGGKTTHSAQWDRREKNLLIVLWEGHGENFQSLPRRKTRKTFKSYSSVQDSNILLSTTQRKEKPGKTITLCPVGGTWRKLSISPQGRERQPFNSPLEEGTTTLHPPPGERNVDLPPSSRGGKTSLNVSPPGRENVHASPHGPMGPPWAMGTDGCLAPPRAEREKKPLNCPLGGTWRNL